MSKTYKLIASTTLSSNGQISFTNIPNTYTDLVLIGYFAPQYSGNVLSIRFNSNSQNIYSYHTMYFTNYAFGSGSSSSATIGGGLGFKNAPFQTSIIHIPSYKNTSMYKNILAYSTSEDGTDTTMARWKSTSAISSIQIGSSNFSIDFLTGSNFSLYGISKYGV